MDISTNCGECGRMFWLKWNTPRYLGADVCKRCWQRIERSDNTAIPLAAEQGNYPT